MTYENQYTYYTKDLEICDKEDSTYMVGESQRDITVRGFNGEMLRLEKSRMSRKEAVEIFAGITGNK